ncbi:MAG: ABC transporter substrate-binding protein [Methylovirgula sp.]
MTRTATLALLAGTMMASLAQLSFAHAETVDVSVGHQSMTTATYPPGVIAQHLGLLEKFLPHDGKYKGMNFNLSWNDYASGPPITNMMMANKLMFGSMGDYPLIVNGAKFQQTPNERSIFIAVTGYNFRGSGEGVVVPLNSPVRSLADLKGKSISVPVGSDAWGMLLKALDDAHMAGAVEIKNQAPAVGAANIANNKIDAHSDFDPWPELMEFRGNARKIFDGSETGVPFLDGIVVRKDFADKYPELVVAMCKAIIAADQWVQKDPVAASVALEQWTGIPKEVHYLYLSKGGILTLDPTIKKPLVEALKYDYGVLAKTKNVPPLDFGQWIDDRYIRQAYKELGMNYDAAVASIDDPKLINATLLPEVWVADKGIETYPTVKAMLKGVAAMNKAGVKINATYVYDANVGVKLFGKTAYFAKGGDGIVKAFLREPDATAYAKTSGGKAMSLTDALANPDILAAAAPASGATKN